MADSASIFISRLSNSTLIHKFYDLTSIQLRYQSFDIRLEDEPRVETLIHQNLIRVPKPTKKKHKNYINMMKFNRVISPSQSMNVNLPTKASNDFIARNSRQKLMQGLVCFFNHFKLRLLVW